MRKREEVEASTVEEFIKLLSKMPKDAPVYFDCPACGKANEFHKVSIGIMVTTE